MTKTIGERAAVYHSGAGASFWRNFIGSAVFCSAIAGFSLGLGAQPQNGVSSEDYLKRLEWRGILVLPGDTQFSLHDQPGERSFWISMGQVRNGVEIVEYDENQVTVRHGEATRSISLSTSSVAALEGGHSAAPPPLVVIGKSGSEESRGQPETPSFDPERAKKLWQQALAESGQLREIDQQFRNINGEEEKVAEALAALESDDPDYESIASRQKELQEERRILMEGASTELRNSSGLSQEAGKELEESLRGGFSSQLGSHQPPEESNGEAEESSPEP